MPNVSFDRAAQYYDATRSLGPGAAERIRDAILQLTHASPATRFLELGIGTGRIALPFILAGHRFTGVDISRAMMAKLQEKIAAAASTSDRRSPHPHYALHEVDIGQPLPYAGNAFDVVLGVHVFHLVEQWHAALEEAMRVLRRPGGRLLIAGDEPLPGEPDDDDPDRMVHDQWDATLRALGYVRREYLPGARPDKAALAAYLHELGATTEDVDLSENDYPPLSLRQMVMRHQARVYSADWNIPDAVFAEAATQLGRWLDTLDTDPDRTISRRGMFRALVAQWRA